MVPEDHLTFPLASPWGWHIWIWVQSCEIFDTPIVGVPRGWILTILGQPFHVFSGTEDFWWLFFFFHLPQVDSFSSESQRSKGFPWNFIQTFMFASWWIAKTLTFLLAPSSCLIFNSSDLVYSQITAKLMMFPSASALNIIPTNISKLVWSLWACWHADNCFYTNSQHCYSFTDLLVGPSLVY